MTDELDVSQVINAVERLQQTYRKPLPGTRHTTIQPGAPENLQNVAEDEGATPNDDVIAAIAETHQMQIGLFNEA